ncbi:hypothetical protein KPH14_007343 [Odynerus spinipes]|uniref:Receptor ligand binding region domain-containing protein n=1 Tax=Odynerus spinipes TaxID=1348599 RepID=A0AAD9RA89_9HYME|nr:hypothetical protein KPH14_007343 [Odynerus spinipes]
MKLPILTSLLILIGWSDGSSGTIARPRFELSEGRKLDWPGAFAVALEDEEAEMHESFRFPHRSQHPLFRWTDRFHAENPWPHRHPIRHARRYFRSMDTTTNVQRSWPIKKEAVIEGDLLLGGLMMVHEREDTITCGPVMPQGGIQALEAMLYTLDRLNTGDGIIPGVKIGAHILDDCDKDTYGLEMAVDFIKGE